MALHNDIGKKGELLACEYLTNLHYEIVTTNWRSGKNELDIIAKLDHTYCFIEVKTRSSNFFGDPETFISKAKIERLLQATNDYIEQHQLLEDIRFDIIGIVLTPKPIIHHFTDVFEVFE